MNAVLDYLFGAASFVPHGYCLLWRPDLVAMHAVSDLVIALSYFSIPIALLVFQRRRADLEYRWMFRLFAAFILGCGATHIVGLWTLWQPVYGFQGLVKVWTALVSSVTAVVLWPVIPRALALPSPTMLREANELLRAENDRRLVAEQALRRAHDELEHRVAARTRELAAANLSLEHEVAVRRQAEAELRLALQRLEQHMTNTPLGVIEITCARSDEEPWCIGRWSGQSPAIFGWQEQEVVGLTVDELALVHEGDRHQLALARQDLTSGRRPHVSFQIRCRTKAGKTRHCRCYASIVHTAEGSPDTVLTLVEDVTERVLVEENIYRLAHHDTLTELPNRLLFRDRLDQALARARRSGQRGVLMLLDLDHFKDVNDSLGHAAGDELLRDTAQRLRGTVRESDTWARLGGDEFALLQTSVEERGDALTTVRRVMRAFAQPFEIEGHRIDVSASVGITHFPDDGNTAERLMRNADLALYRAKAAGRRCFELYRPELDVELRANRSLQRGLREALEQEALSLVFQPQFDLDLGQPVQAEALVRWRHPGGGEVAPAIFIPVAETSGLIQPLGEWVLAAACRQAAAWRDAGLALKVGVNVSASQLRHPELLAVVSRALRSANLAPELLELELTESVFLDPSKDLIIGTLRKLAEIGVTLAIDDFGIGYSSLAYLKHFPFHQVKIDRSFVKDIGRDPESDAIVAAVIALAHSLGKRVTAEGVETHEQLAFLSDRSCDAAQGYLLGRPQSADQLARLLSRASA